MEVARQSQNAPKSSWPIVIALSLTGGALGYYVGAFSAQSDGCEVVEAAYSPRGSYLAQVCVKYGNATSTNGEIIRIKPNRARSEFVEMAVLGSVIVERPRTRMLRWSEDERTLTIQFQSADVFRMVEHLSHDGGKVNLRFSGVVRRRQSN